MTHRFAKNVIRPHLARGRPRPPHPRRFLVRLQRCAGCIVAGRGAAPSTAARAAARATTKDKKGKTQTNRFALIGAEEMAWGDAGVLLSLPGPGLGGPPVRVTGTPEQKERFFGIFKTARAALGRLRPHRAGRRQRRRRHPHDAAARTATTGCSTVASASSPTARAPIVGGDLRHRRSRAGPRRASRVRRREGHARASAVGKIEEKMGLRASETAELVLEDCRVPEENLLGGEAHYDAARKAS